MDNNINNNQNNKQPTFLDNLLVQLQQLDESMAAEDIELTKLEESIQRLNETFRRLLAEKRSQRQSSGGNGKVSSQIK